MFYDRELLSVFIVWLALVILAGYWTVRILMMLERQRRAEALYRLQLAVTMGRATREGSTGADAAGQSR